MEEADIPQAVWKRVQTTVYRYGGYDRSGNLTREHPEYTLDNTYRPACPICGELLALKRAWYCNTCRDYRADPPRNHA